MLKKIIFINNYPSPYRNYLFNAMHERNVEFEVYHETTGAKDRHWRFDGDEIKYYNHFGKPLFKTFSGSTFNPGMLIKMIRSSKEIEYVIPGWGGINQVCIFLLKKIGLIRNTLHVWCEANYLDISGKKRTNGVKNWIRKFCMNTADGKVLIPGLMAKKSLKHFGIHIDENRYVLFPNVIEDEKFSFRKPRQMTDLPVFISPVRLIEHLKGIRNFFEAIGAENILKAKFLIAGEGEDRQNYIDFITENGYQNNIELLGFLNSDQMEDVYSKADVMLLPSFYDPSPLTLVEATKKGLVILASNHCGNHYEAIECGINGESFNPLDKEEIKLAFEKLMSDIDKWPKYSEHSVEIYNKKFKPEIVIDSLVKSLFN